MSISIQISSKAPSQFKIPRNHRVITNQVKSPSGWHKRQCADFNNTDKVVIHEARYKTIAVHFPHQFTYKKT